MEDDIMFDEKILDQIASEYLDLENFYGYFSPQLIKSKIVLTPIRYNCKGKKGIEAVNRYNLLKFDKNIVWNDTKHNNASTGEYFGFVIDDDTVLIYKIIGKNAKKLILHNDLVYKTTWEEFKLFQGFSMNWFLNHSIRTNFLIFI